MQPDKTAPVKGFFDRLNGTIAGVVAAPGDDDDLILQKVTLSTAASIIALAGIFWSASYFFLGAKLAAISPICYTIGVTLAGLHFLASKKIEVFRLVHSGLILVMPFTLQWSLGGFQPSSAVMIWGLLAPMGVLMFGDGRLAVRFFLAFIALTVFSGIIDIWLVRFDPDPLPTWSVMAFFVLNLAAVSTIAVLLLLRFVDQREQARAQSEELLLNMLPRAIAQRLRNNPGTIADIHGDASILFADIVGFTSLSASLIPRQVVELLDGLFGDFDQAAAEIGLEKIKTIGDAYMAASGVPEACPDHAERAARLGLRMIEIAREHRERTGWPIELRIGIHSGTVIAGVIGRNKLTYDIWGDAVNMAARMEAAGVPGRVQITRATQSLLRDEFEFEDRGNIDIRGLGPTPAFLLKREMV